VPHADAAFSAGRAALLVAALTGETDALLPATDDRLHQSYRAPAMPESAQLVAGLRAAGIPAVISGAGPSVLALTRDRAESAAAQELTPAGWRPLELAVAAAGARVAPVTG
jgi:homoserine kinase